jgi:Cu-Zn family superoxide dismutase
MAAAAGLLAVTAAGCGAADEPSSSSSSSSSPSSSSSYELPGDEVFPEGTGVNKANGDFFVGSTTDGTIYRGTLNPAERSSMTSAAAS